MATEAAARRDALIDQAIRHFVAYGYKATTMEGLAASLGASKSTIYRQYGSKAHLLRAAMDRSVPMITDLLARVDVTEGRAIEAVLRDFAIVTQQFHADPGMRNMWRAISEAWDDLKQFLHDSAEQETLALAPIADYLAVMEAKGRLVVGNPQAMAACFAELASGGLTGFLGSAPTLEQRQRTIERTLTLFLKGVLPR